ncbi:zonadhesin-like [Pristis pectinata]|uniref:zonadhesin-like n=1 Tax=Pristis pectinata TaxID=685728 RepID=UPI00223D337F|nr:zonadhesin-like [Pristis pectinata]
MLCASFEMYVQACQANGTALPDWRKYTGCAMACPPNSSYRPCMAACPPTCANLAAPSECDSPCMEGCECNRGFVYSGFDCVPYSQCGCTYRNKYYEVGERFLTDDCTEDCNCNMTDTIQCSTMRCPENTTCTIINSKRTCGLTCGSDTCQNGGTCAETKSGIKCLCHPLYRGKYCEDNTIIIIIAVLVPIVVLLIGALMIYLFCCRNGGVKERDSTSDISSIVSYDNIADLTQSWQLDQGARHGGVSNPQYQR